MLIIDCPWCGPRDQSEFSYGGEGGLKLPGEPDALTDVEWADYLFFRKNPKGMHHELWVHSVGCRQWFNAHRDTVSYRITTTYPINTADQPALEAG